MDKLMNIELDIFEMYYLLESCFRGSHLRTQTIYRFVDEFYVWFSPEERKNLHDWIVRDIYDGKFEPRSQLCGADRVFMARYNPDNQYEVTVREPVRPNNGKNVGAVIWERQVFLLDGKYYVSSRTYIDNESIIEITKI